MLTPQQVQEYRKEYGIGVPPSQAQIETWKSQYHVTPVYNRDEWLQNLEFIALCILLAFVIFFVIKGAFYYIVLGKINPPKE